MRNKILQPVSKCQNKVLQFYQHNIKLQNQLLANIRIKLPSDLAEHLSGCTITAKKLLLYTDAEQWLDLLRFCRPLVLEAVNESLLVSIETVEFKVLNQHLLYQNSRKISLPSQSNIDLLRDTGDILDDDKLKQSLLKLSQTLARLSNADSLQ